MGLVPPTVKAHHPVAAVLIQGSSNGPDHDLLAWRYVSEDAGSGVVVQKFAEALCGDLGHIVHLLPEKEDRRKRWEHD